MLIFYNSDIVFFRPPNWASNFPIIIFLTDGARQKGLENTSTNILTLLSYLALRNIITKRKSIKNSNLDIQHNFRWSNLRISLISKGCSAGSFAANKLNLIFLHKVFCEHTYVTSFHFSSILHSAAFSPHHIDVSVVSTGNR